MPTVRRALWAGLVVVLGVVAGLVFVLVDDDGSTSPRTPSAVGDLISAVNPECATVGQLVADYLRSGDTHGQPRLDLYASTRARIVSQPGEVQGGLIREAADRAIIQCDKNVGTGQD